MRLDDRSNQRPAAPRVREGFSIAPRYAVPPPPASGAPDEPSQVYRGDAAMQDDHDDVAIVINAYGFFVRVRRNVAAGDVVCPLCDKSMYRLLRPPVVATCAGHALWLANRVVFYACPDREQPGHRAMIADFRVAD